MEIKVGEYFRNKYGIAKLIKIEEQDGIQVLTLDRKIVFLVNTENGEIKDDRLINKIALLDNIDLNKVKHSQNIINLIEVRRFCRN